MNEFEQKAAAAVSSEGYRSALAEAEALAAREERRRHRARIFELSRVAVEALNGEHGPQAQSDATVALTKDGDMRPDVAALARAEHARRTHQEVTPLEVPIVKQALQNKAIEYALRALEAVLRDTRDERKAKR